MQEVILRVFITSPGYADSFSTGASNANGVVEWCHVESYPEVESIRVVYDSNGNGLHDPGEAYADATVTWETPIVQDWFSRTISSGWGSGRFGGPWFLKFVAGTTVTDATSSASVSEGKGRATVSTTGGPRYFTAVAGSTTAANYEVLATLNSGPAGALIGVLGRASASGSYLAWMTVGQNTLKINTGAVAGPLGTGTLSGPVMANTDYKIRFQLQGTSLRARAWQASATEPASWQVTATDGNVATGLAGLLAGFPNTGAGAFTFDEIHVIPLGAASGAATSSAR